MDIREIGAESTPEQGFMTAYKTAKKDAFKGEPMRKRVDNNRVRIASYATAGLWDGQPERYSWYA